MYQEIYILFSEEQKANQKLLLEELKKQLSWPPIPKGPVFIIGSWQTGDLGHVYAAAVRHFSLDRGTPFSILILQADGFSDKFLLEDAKFAVGSVRRQCEGSFSLLHTAPIKKTSAISLMSELMKQLDNAREPFDATFWAEEAVKAMSHGQPLTPVWSALATEQVKEHWDEYDKVCKSFMEEYVNKFGKSQGRENFVCLWGRTSGAPAAKQPLGGANPQYDSSNFGNYQLCVELGNKLKVKCIFTVGDGFDDKTKVLPCVFDLGQFWTKMNVKGRFQENGFFDFMTAFYDCNVVHVGMKSGGMDVLGLWGQKVVFIDSLQSPEVTRERVLAWKTEHLQPVEISQMPTALGQAIEEQRIANEKERNPIETERQKILDITLKPLYAERDSLEVKWKKADQEKSKDLKALTTQRQELNLKIKEFESQRSGLRKKLDSIQKPFKTTFDNKEQLEEIKKLAEKKKDGFTDKDLEKIVANVRQMLQS